MNKIKSFVLFASMILCCSAYAVPIDSDGTGPSGVPEPATIALMSAGLAGIGIAAWRRNRRK
jgi:hypothetical protein